MFVRNQDFLWHAGYHYGEPTGYQYHTCGLNCYRPVHGAGLFKPDDYAFHSSLGAAAIANWDINDKSVAIRELQNRFQELRCCALYAIEIISR